MDVRSMLAKRENRRTGEGLAVFGLALERLQKFALEHKLLDKPVFGKLEKPRADQRGSAERPGAVPRTPRMRNEDLPREGNRIRPPPARARKHQHDPALHAPRRPGDG